MTKFRVLMRVDAYVEYETEVDADSPKGAVDVAYSGGGAIAWTEVRTRQFDARHVVALDGMGHEIEGTQWGKG